MLKESLLGWGGINFKQQKIVLENKKVWLRGMVGSTASTVDGNLYKWTSSTKSYYTRVENPKITDRAFPLDTTKSSGYVTSVLSPTSITIFDPDDDSNSTYTLVGEEASVNTYTTTDYVERIYLVNLDGSQSGEYFDITINADTNTYENEKFYFDKQTQTVLRIAYSTPIYDAKYVRLVIDLLNPNNGELLDHHVIGARNDSVMAFENGINCRQGLYAFYFGKTYEGGKAIIYSPRYHHLFEVNLTSAIGYIYDDSGTPSDHLDSADMLMGIYNLSEDLDDLSKILLSVYVPNPVNSHGDNAKQQVYPITVDLMVNPALAISDSLVNVDTYGNPSVSDTGAVTNVDSNNYVFTTEDLHFQFGSGVSSIILQYRLLSDFYNEARELTLLEPVSPDTPGYIFKVCCDGIEDKAYFKRIYRDLTGNYNTVSSTPIAITVGTMNTFRWEITAQNVENFSNYSGDATLLRSKPDAEQRYKIGSENLTVFLVDSEIDSTTDDRFEVVSEYLMNNGTCPIPYSKVLDLSSDMVLAGVVYPCILYENGMISSFVATNTTISVSAPEDTTFPELKSENIDNGRWVSFKRTLLGGSLVSSYKKIIAVSNNGYMAINSESALSTPEPFTVFRFASVNNIVDVTSSERTLGVSSNAAVRVVLSSDGTLYRFPNTTDDTFNTYSLPTITGVNLTWTNITYNLGRYMAVAVDGLGNSYTTMSYDAIDWSVPQLHTGITPGSILPIYTGDSVGGGFVFYGANNKITSTVYGESWSAPLLNTMLNSRPVGDIEIFKSDFYHNSDVGKFLFYNRIYSDNGIQKSELYFSKDDRMRFGGFNNTSDYPIAYGNGVYISGAGTRLVTSTDGKRWQLLDGEFENLETWASSGGIDFVLFANGYFYAFLKYVKLEGDQYYRFAIYRSQDGLSWSYVSNNPITSGNISYLYDGSNFIVLRLYNNVYEIYKSPDCINWSSVTIPTTQTSIIGYLGRLYYLKGKYYLFKAANSDSDVELLVLDDLSGNPGTYHEYDVIFDNCDTTAESVYNLNNDVSYSTTGNWEKIRIGAVNVLVGTQTVTRKRYVALSAKGYFSYSEDGVNWSVPAKLYENADSATWNILIYGNKKFMAISTTGIVYTSTNGSTWTAGSTITLPAGNTSISTGCYAPSIGKYLLIIKHGTLISTNGSTWTYYNDETLSSKSWTAAVWNGSKFIAYSGNNIAISNDGESWEFNSMYEFSHTTTSKDIIYDGTRFIVFGSLFACSVDGINWFPRSALSGLGISSSTKSGDVDGGKLYFITNQGLISVRQPYNGVMRRSLANYIFYNPYTDDFNTVSTGELAGLLRGEFSEYNGSEVFYFKYYQTPLKYIPSGSTTRTVDNYLIMIPRTNSSPKNDFLVTTKKLLIPQVGEIKQTSTSWIGGVHDQIDLDDNGRAYMVTSANDRYTMLPSKGWSTIFYNSSNNAEYVVDYNIIPTQPTDENGVSVFELKQDLVKSDVTLLGTSVIYDTSATLGLGQYTNIYLPISDSTNYTGDVYNHSFVELPDTSEESLLTFNGVSGVYSTYAPRFTNGPKILVSSTKLDQSGVICEADVTITKTYADEAYALILERDSLPSTLVVVSETERGATCSSSDDNIEKITHRFTFNNKTYYAYVAEVTSITDAHGIDTVIGGKESLYENIAKVLGDGSYTNYFSTILFEDHISDDFGGDTPTYNITYRLLRGDGSIDHSDLLIGYDIVSGNSTTAFTSPIKLNSEYALILTSNSNQSGDPRYLTYVIPDDDAYKTSTIASTSTKVDCNRNTQYLSDVSNMTNTTFRVGGTNIPPVVLVDGESEPVTLTINPTPADATVTFSTGIVVGNSCTVNAGTSVTYTVEKVGYITKEYTIAVSSDTTLNVVLAGHVTLTINPTPADAVVTLTCSNYEQVGNSITVPQGSTVSYTIVRSPLKTVSSSIVVEDETTLNINMSYPSGTVLFESNTAGTYTLQPLVPVSCNVVAVGAGGGGAAAITTVGTLSNTNYYLALAGGGSGKYVNSNISLTATAHTVKVGSGGAGTKKADTSKVTLTASSGGASSVDSVVSVAGGTGGYVHTSWNGRVSTGGTGGNTGGNFNKHYQNNAAANSVSGGAAAYGSYGKGGGASNAKTTFSPVSSNFLTASNGAAGYIKITAL